MLLYVMQVVIPIINFVALIIIIEIFMDLITHKIFLIARVLYISGYILYSVNMHMVTIHTMLSIIIEQCFAAIISIIGISTISSNLTS